LFTTGMVNFNMIIIFPTMVTATGMNTDKESSMKQRLLLESQEGYVKKKRGARSKRWWQRHCVEDLDTSRWVVVKKRNGSWGQKVFRIGVGPR